MRAANLSLFHSLPYTSIISVKAAIEADLQLDARAFHCLQGPVYRLKVQGNRFLTKDVLASLRRFLDDPSMGIGGRTDHYCLDTWMIQYRPVILRESRNIVVFRTLPGCIFDRIRHDAQSC